MKNRSIFDRVKYAVLFTVAAMSIASTPTVAATRGEFSSNGSSYKLKYLVPGNEPANHRFAADVFGYFFIKGKAPAGFTNIDFLELGGDGEYGAGAKPPHYGLIRLTGKRRTDYKLLKPTLAGNGLSFQTKAVAGISYKFEGTLNHTDFTDNQPDGDAVVLTGTLTKLRNGKSIAQAKLNFTWSVGD